MRGQRPLTEMRDWAKKINRDQGFEPNLTGNRDQKILKGRGIQVQFNRDG